MSFYKINQSNITFLESTPTVCQQAALAFFENEVKPKDIHLHHLFNLKDNAKIGVYHHLVRNYKNRNYSKEIHVLKDFMTIIDGVRFIGKSDKDCIYETKIDSINQKIYLKKAVINVQLASILYSRYCHDLAFVIDKDGNFIKGKVIEICTLDDFCPICGKHKHVKHNLDISKMEVVYK